MDSPPGKNCFPNSQCFIEISESQPKPSPIPKNYPPWASWSSKEVYLPPSFHKGKSFDEALAVLKMDLSDPSIFKKNLVDSPLLLLGLMFREVSRSMEVEPGEPTSHPSQVVDSGFGIQEMKKLEKMLDAISIPPKK